jgi:hypothetical protein
MRKIHIQNQVYRYKVGKQHVKIIFPDRHVLVADFSQITGINWTDIERFAWKNRSGFPIKPSKIRAYIEKKLGEVI